jgi:hypothetical protein
MDHGITAVVRSCTSAWSRYQLKVNGEIFAGTYFGAVLVSAD